MSDLARRDVKLSGFVANDVKRQWTPAQRGELLGFVLDLSAGTFQVPHKRVDSFCLLLEIIVSKGFVASARQLSRFTWVWLLQHLFGFGRIVCTATSLNILGQSIRMSNDAVCDVLF